MSVIEEQRVLLFPDALETLRASVAARPEYAGKSIEEMLVASLEGFKRVGRRDFLPPAFNDVDAQYVDSEKLIGAIRTHGLSQALFIDEEQGGAFRLNLAEQRAVLDAMFEIGMESVFYHPDDHQRRAHHKEVDIELRLDKWRAINALIHDVYELNYPYGTTQLEIQARMDVALAEHERAKGQVQMGSIFRLRHGAPLHTKHVLGHVVRDMQTVRERLGDDVSDRLATIIDQIERQEKEHHENHDGGEGLGEFSVGGDRATMTEKDKQDLSASLDVMELYVMDREADWHAALCVLEEEGVITRNEALEYLQLHMDNEVQAEKRGLLLNQGNFKALLAQSREIDARREERALAKEADMPADEINARYPSLSLPNLLSKQYALKRDDQGNAVYQLDNLINDTRILAAYDEIRSAGSDGIDSARAVMSMSPAEVLLRAPFTDGHHLPEYKRHDVARFLTKSYTHRHHKDPMANVAHTGEEEIPSASEYKRENDPFLRRYAKLRERSQSQDDFWRFDIISNPDANPELARYLAEQYPYASDAERAAMLNDEGFMLGLGGLSLSAEVKGNPTVNAWQNYYLLSLLDGDVRNAWTLQQWSDHYDEAYNKANAAMDAAQTDDAFDIAASDRDTAADYKDRIDALIDGGYEQDTMFTRAQQALAEGDTSTKDEVLDIAEKSLSLAQLAELEIDPDYKRVFTELAKVTEKEILQTVRRQASVFPEEYRLNGYHTYGQVAGFKIVPFSEYDEMQRRDTSRELLGRTPMIDYNPDADAALLDTVVQWQSQVKSAAAGEVEVPDVLRARFGDAMSSDSLIMIMTTQEAMVQHLEQRIAASEVAG